MREIFRHRDSVKVGLYQSILEEAQIVCFIKNSLTHQRAAGSEFDPVLCVQYDEDFGRALQILAAHEAIDQPAGKEWVCPACKEPVPGELDTCWSCERERLEV